MNSPVERLKDLLVGIGTCALLVGGVFFLATAPGWFFVLLLIAVLLPCFAHLGRDIRRGL